MAFQCLMTYKPAHLVPYRSVHWKITHSKITHSLISFILVTPKFQILLAGTNNTVMFFLCMKVFLLSRNSNPEDVINMFYKLVIIINF